MPAQFCPRCGCVVVEVGSWQKRFPNGEQPPSAVKVFRCVNPQCKAESVASAVVMPPMSRASA